MNAWCFVPTTVFIFIADYFYVRQKMKQMRGVIQTLQITELQNSVLNDLFVSPQSTDKIHEIVVVSLTSLQSKERFNQGTQLLCLNAFADVVCKSISSGDVKDQIENVCRTPYLMSIMDYIWLHELVYRSKVRALYIDFAFDALSQFVNSIEKRTMYAMQYS